MEDEKINCARCGNQVDETLTYCDACGEKLHHICPHCDNRHSAGTQFCPLTGKPLSGKSSLWTQVRDIVTLSFKTLASRIAPGTAALVVFLTLLGALGVSYFNSHPVIPHWNISIQQVQTPRIDVVFTLDSTGSMGDEIQTVKEKIKSMAKEIKRGKPSPDVRFGLVVYRDRGDEYVVKSYPFSRDINKFSALVNDVNASGGGDMPESVNEALDVAVNRLPWEQGQNVQKLLFLIGDAGPHTDYNNGLNYAGIAQQASSKGISIFTIGCSGLESFGTQVFTEIASSTGGRFDNLTYQVAYQTPEGETHYVLNAGGRSFKVDSSVVKDESWRSGAVALEKKGRADEVKESEAASMPGGPECYYASKSMVSSGAAKNNLDSLMTDVIKEKAKKMGVTY